MSNNHNHNHNNRNQQQPQQPDKPAGRSLSAERIEEIRRRRQARGDIIDGPRLKLDVPQKYKDPAWEYRWVNDSERRIAELQDRDWEFVPPLDDDRNSGIGTRVERIVNERTTANAEKAFLMRKPKEFYEEDRKRRQSRIDATEKQLASGKVDAPDALGDGGYIPSSGMRIDVGQNLKP